ncbi:MAG: hypothetical protein DIU69_10280 [Bacillota bacterium]|nr:MAG: hypothetical protein DIU69_10280 [Bacillota bacterium]
MVLVGGMGVFANVIPLPFKQDVARPPCEKLPDQSSVAQALAAHGDLVARLERIGSGVKVEVATPCKGQPDRALIRISYATKAERAGIDQVLAREWFGVPVEVVRN